MNVLIKRLDNFSLLSRLAFASCGTNPMNFINIFVITHATLQAKDSKHSHKKICYHNEYINSLIQTILLPIMKLTVCNECRIALFKYYLQHPGYGLSKWNWGCVRFASYVLCYFGYFSLDFIHFITQVLFSQNNKVYRIQ